jgi:hypothetical protein
MLIHPLRQKSTTLGMHDAVVPQVHSIELLQNDIVLFSTDGLHEILDDTEIEYIVNCSSNTAEAVKGLVAAVKTAGGTDDIAVALAYCSPTPMELNAGYAAGVHASGMTKRTKTIIGVWAAVAVLVLGALAAYLLIPTGQAPMKVFEPTLVAARLPEVKDSAATRAAADTTQVRSTVPDTSTPVVTATPAPAVPATRVTVQVKKNKTEAPFPQMNVEWNAETKRFRIKVREASVVPVSLSYGGVSYDVAAVKSIQNMYKTTTPAEVEAAPKKNVVTIRLKGAEKRSGAVAFTINE